MDKQPRSLHVAQKFVAQGPGGYGFFMFGSDQPIDFDEASIREVLARPGILADMTSAFDSPKLDVDGWVGRIPSLIRLSGDQVSAFASPARRPWVIRRLDRPGNVGRPGRAEPVRDPVQPLGIPSGLVGRLRRIGPRGHAPHRGPGPAGRLGPGRGRAAHASPRGRAR